jgi:hypothetical protein
MSTSWKQQNITKVNFKLERFVLRNVLHGKHMRSHIQSWKLGLRFCPVSLSMSMVTANVMDGLCSILSKCRLMYSKWSYLIKNETQMCTKGARNTEVCCQSKTVLQKYVKKKCTQAVDCSKLVVFQYFTIESIYRMLLIIELHF